MLILCDGIVLFIYLFLLYLYPAYLVISTTLVPPVLFFTPHFKVNVPQFSGSVVQDAGNPKGCCVFSHTLALPRGTALCSFTPVHTMCYRSQTRQIRFRHKNSTDFAYCTLVYLIVCWGKIHLCFKTYYAVSFF